MQIIKDVYAEVNFGDSTLNPVAKFDSLAKFVNLIIPLMMIVGGLLTLSMLLYGAFMYITSEGNPEKLKKSQAVFLYAVLGIFLMVASFVFTKIIGGVFNVALPL